MADPSIQNLVVERRALRNRISRLNRELAATQSRLALCEVKLICHGYDIKAADARTHPKKWFAGRNLWRRAIRLLRSEAQPMTELEIATQLASEDGQDLNTPYRKRTAQRRVNRALYRALNKPGFPISVETADGQRFWSLETP